MVKISVIDVCLILGIISVSILIIVTLVIINNVSLNEYLTRDVLIVINVSLTVTSPLVSFIGGIILGFGYSLILALIGTLITKCCSRWNRCNYDDLDLDSTCCICTKNEDDSCFDICIRLCCCCCCVCCDQWDCDCFITQFCKSIPSKCRNCCRENNEDIIVYAVDSIPTKTIQPV